ncbi:hypothetical protein LOCC1_G003936 [Lachnellula occidentalis]|uniref:DUF7587 domain-containing protein n=1 Tax=Lachnellula occidentalis TaxID=215460 RepID=A0A8H8S5N1_9HELO|nr:hypothetical protein LOCC1_G003936 [Lachnellula occidentalis]
MRGRCGGDTDHESLNAATKRLPDLDPALFPNQGKDDIMGSLDEDELAAESVDLSETELTLMSDGETQDLASEIVNKEYDEKEGFKMGGVKRKATENGSDENVTKQKRSRQGMVTNHLDGDEPDKEIEANPDNVQEQTEDEDEDEDEPFEDGTFKVKSSEASNTIPVQGSDEPSAFKPGVKKPDPRDIIRDKQHRVVIKELRSTLQKSGGALTMGELQSCLDMVDVLNEKYINVTAKKIYSRKKGKHPQDQEVMIKRFEGKEERAHPWATASHPDEIPGLLMRAWDQKSQCQIKDYRVGFLSGGSTHFLDTKAKRTLALKQHADWGNRSKTPFISFSSSLREIGLSRVPHFQERQANCGILDNTKLTIINARARNAAGLPILRMKDELLHYNVTNKYGDPRFEKDSFYENEYIVPFSVRPEEIVRTYAWHDIERWMETNRAEFEDWYIKVGVEDFKEHERVRLGGTPAKCKDGCDCCGQ